jgi:hypothetical protein
MSHKELNELVHVLRWLLKDGDTYFRNEADDKERELHARLAQTFEQLTDRELDATRSTGVPPGDRFLHARPIRKGDPTMFPVMKIKWFFGKYLTLGLHIGLFQLGDVENPIKSSTGWRFETPSSWATGDDNNPLDKSKKKNKSETIQPSILKQPHDAADGTGDETAKQVGLHEYFHAQAITGFEKDHYFPNLVKPINSTQPAFRLEAWNTPSLSVNALVSLYGRDPAFFAPLTNSSGSVSQNNLWPLKKVEDNKGGPAT